MPLVQLSTRARHVTFHRVFAWTIVALDTLLELLLVYINPEDIVWLTFDEILIRLTRLTVTPWDNSCHKGTVPIIGIIMKIVL